MFGPGRTFGIALAGLSAAAIALATVPATAAAPGSGNSAGKPVVTSANPAPTYKSGTYIVQLADQPVLSYEGGVSGLKATKPAVGTKVRRDNTAVKSYRSYLGKQRGKLLAKIGGAKKLYDYDYTFAGFAAKLTGDQAAELAKTPGVLSVTKDDIRKLDTSSTPTFLGLTGKGGMWEKLGGIDKAGDGVIVGVVDSGFWPESKSFAPIKTTKASDRLIKRKFDGSCDKGIEQPYVKCNNKVIGARYFLEGTGVDNVDKSDFISPRDGGGHGSHTASTAAGNNGVQATVEGSDLGKVSGMAPHARISIYKVCWTTGGGGCAGSDSVAAIDTAIADGVDVINFSISGSSASVVDPVELAFFRAARAGVFVAASAGNSGPGASTVAHNSPWLTTVAAGTHDRVYEASVTLGNGSTYTGSGQGAAVPSSPVVLSTAVGLPGKPANEVQLCFIGALDPAKVAGKIVVCDRGVNARVDKSAAVKQAGGVGVILANTAPSSLNADLHTLPTVHVDETAGAAIKAYVSANPSATASLAQGEGVAGAEAPWVASFSSRGPALAGGGDLLKPDIMAPGVDVLAAVAPPSNSGRDFDYYSGTSMSSPHIAGLAALVIQAHPRWSPAAVKSALMTTATTLDNKGNPIVNDTGTAASALDYGAGQVVPTKALDPGLVYDSGPKDWLRYLCGLGQLPASDRSCKKLGTIDASNLNYPSIAAGDLAGDQTITRTVTNVSRSRSTYTAHVSSPAGFSMSVVPSKLRLSPGQSAHVKIKLTRTSAAFGAYAFGSLMWKDGTHAVQSPIVVKPVRVAAALEVRGAGASGSAKIATKAGYTGTLTASAAGLVPAVESKATLTSPDGSAFPTDAPAANAHVAKFTVPIAAGSTLARFSLYDSDYAAGSDLDMFVYKAGTAELVGSSAGGSAEEQVDITDPAAGSYDVYVDLFGLAPGQTSLEVKHSTWGLGSTSAGNLTVTPASQPAKSGKSGSVTAAWTGLSAGKRWLGRVTYGDGTNPIGSTILRVDS